MSVSWQSLKTREEIDCRGKDLWRIASQGYWPSLLQVIYESAVTLSAQVRTRKLSAAYPP